ncbi:MAG: ABC transporter ATP-binding protein [Peptoniphilaceae bacterium]|nr:ABC transporter ATP-binding protein [Peptoniphilaceae bacterium]MDY6085319.1 ABC transporter ATP-binding protein [Peptoniphilaceae bacterium]
MLKKVIPYTKHYRKEIFLTPLFMVLEVFADILIPLLMITLVDEGIAKNDIALVYRQALFMVVAAIFGMFFGGISSYFGAKAGYGMAGNLRKAAYAAIQKFSFSNIDKISVPSLITRLTTDIETIGMVGMMSLRMAFRAPFMLIFALFFSFRINSGLAIIFAVTLPLSALAIALIFRKVMPIFQESRRRVDDLNGIIQEQLSGMRIIKAFVRNKTAEAEFEKRNRATLNTELRAIRIVQIMNPIFTLMIYTALLFILYNGGRQVYEGTMLPGTIIGFSTYVIQIMVSLMMISMFLANFSFGITSLRRVLEILETRSEITTPEHPVTEVPDGSIRFDHVSFCYPGYKDNILEDVTLSIASGETVGIIGPTGSSKSTLVKLIPRLYDAQSGAVIVGGHNVKDYGPLALRRAIGFVLQNNTLISGTIASNMRWGNAQATDEQIVDALQKAQAWEFVSRYPDTINHPVEQGGANFSGGQKQRLTIARALLTEPKILILDDSTSALDMSTDARLRRVLRDHREDMTTLIIAQRIASIREADQIIVLDEGRVAATGTHESLIRDSEIYREIVQSQEGGLAQ